MLSRSQWETELVARDKSCWRVPLQTTWPLAYLICPDSAGHVSKTRASAQSVTPRRLRGLCRLQRSSPFLILIYAYPLRFSPCFGRKFHFFTPRSAFLFLLSFLCLLTPPFPPPALNRHLSRGHPSWLMHSVALLMRFKTFRSMHPWIEPFSRIVWCPVNPRLKYVTPRGLRTFDF